VPTFNSISLSTGEVRRFQVFFTLFVNP